MGRTSLLAGLRLRATWPPSEETEQRLRAAMSDADLRRDPVHSIEARLLLASLVYTPRHALTTSRLWATEALTLTVHPGMRAQAILTAELPRALLGDGAAVLEHLGEAAGLAQSANDRALLAQIDAIRLLIDHDLGDPRLAHRRSEFLSPGGSALDARWSWLAVRIHTERGELERARRADAQPAPNGTSLLCRHLRQLASASLLAELGENEEAVHRLRALIDEGERSNFLLLLPEAYARLIVLEAPRDPGLARRHFDRLDQTTAGEGDLPRETFWRLMARGALRLGQGDTDGALSSMSDAVNAAERKGLTNLAARAQTMVAEVERQRPRQTHVASVRGP